MAVKNIKLKQINGTYFSTPIILNTKNIMIDDQINLADKIDDWDNKIDKEDGKTLTSNDYSIFYKTKLSTIEDNADENIIEHIKINNIEQEIDENGKVHINFPNTDNLSPLMHISSTDEYGAGTEEYYGHIKIGNNFCQAVKGDDIRMTNKRKPFSHTSNNAEDYGAGTEEKYGHIKIRDVSNFNEFIGYIKSLENFDASETVKSSVILYGNNGWNRSTNGSGIKTIKYIPEYMELTTEENSMCMPNGPVYGRRPSVSLCNDYSIICLEIDEAISLNVMLIESGGVLPMKLEHEDWTRDIFIPTSYPNIQSFVMKGVGEYTFTDTYFGNSLTINIPEPGSIITANFPFKKANVCLYTNDKNLYNSKITIESDNILRYNGRVLSDSEMKFLNGSFVFYVLRTGTITAKILSETNEILKTVEINIDELNKNYAINIDDY